jgi:lipoate-protein ligase A
MPGLRLLPFTQASGSWNMAADEVMLQGAADGVASLRFYGWEEATVSLGYFQESAPVREHARLKSLPLVRRASGGAALVHHHEITYAVALPARPPWLEQRASWIHRFHGLIQKTLASFGVSCTVCTSESFRVPPRTTGDRLQVPILCFLHHTPGDLLVGDCKVTGSAQRKRRDALLQHGGILLAQSPHTPELPGIREATGVVVDPVRLQEGLASGLAADLDCSLDADDWSGDERRCILEIATARYLAPAWTLRR